MKKLVTMILAAGLMVGMLSGCSDKKEVTIDINATAVEMIEASGMEFELVKMGDKIVEKYYDLEGVSEYVMYGEATGASAEEVTIVKVEKEENIEAVTQMFRDRIESQKVRYENYVPSELVKINVGTVVVNGKYVAFIVSADPAGAETVFTNAGKA